MAGKVNSGRNNLAWGILAVLFLIILAINLNSFFKLDKILQIRDLDATVIVGGKTGFDLNTTALTFGKISPGGSLTRRVVLENPYDFPVEVEIYGKGEMEQFVGVSKDRLEAGESKNITVSAVVPKGKEYGNYSGKVEIRFLKI